MRIMLTLLEMDLVLLSSIQYVVLVKLTPKTEAPQSSSEEAFWKEKLGRGGALKIPVLFRKELAMLLFCVVSWVRQELR